MAPLLLLALALAASWFLERAETLSGAVVVVDGDSLRMDGSDIRLIGIDAPELGQVCERAGRPYRCGQEALAALDELVRDAPVECVTSERDRYGRSLARCSVGGRDLGAILVERGLAVASGDYTREERAAREAGRGLWAGSFEMPKEWREKNARGS